MNPQSRFVKTEKGQEEIRNRTHRLQPRLRSLLVLVDGTKPVAELVQAAAAFGGGPGVLEALLKVRVIEEALHGKQPPPIPPPPPARAGWPGGARAGVRVEGLRRGVRQEGPRDRGDRKRLMAGRPRRGR